jgi:hypothetical protein
MLWAGNSLVRPNESQTQAAFVLRELDSLAWR